MRKIVFFAHGNVVGTDTADLQVFEDDVTTEHLDAFAESFGMEWADSYDFGPDEDEDPEEYEQNYYEACGWWWEEYSPAKHNGVIDSDAEGYEEE